MEMKIVRLEVGSLEGEAKVDEKKAYLDKPVMLVYEGDFSSLDGPVTISSEDIDKLVSNHNSFLGKLSRLANGDIPLKHAPPLQLDHSTSARDTVGRLVGEIKVGEHLGEDGQPRKAIMGTARILGADNIERVLDGRWTNVSIGADLENHKITELSITPFPAAADASLLKRGEAELARSVFPGKYKGVEFTVMYEAPMYFYKIDGQRVNKYNYNSENEAIRGAKNYIDQQTSGRLSEGEAHLAELKPGQKVEVWVMADGSEEQVEGVVKVDDGKMVSVEYKHPIYGDKVTKLFPKKKVYALAALAETYKNHKISVKQTIQGLYPQIDGKTLDYVCDSISEATKVAKDFIDGKVGEIDYMSAASTESLSRLASPAELESKIEGMLKRIGVDAIVGVSGRSIVVGVDSPKDRKTVEALFRKMSEFYEITDVYASGEGINIVIRVKDGSGLSARMAELSANVTIEKAKDTGKFFIRVGTEPIAGKDYDTAEEAKKAATEYVKRVYGEEPGSIKVKLSEGGDEMPSYKEMKEKMAMYDKCRKHLVEQEKMSDEDADKKLEAATDDDLTAMSAAADDMEKRMSEEAEKKAEEEKMRMSAMKEHKDRLVQLAKGFKTTTGKINLAERKSKIMVRLAKLKAEQKISPAEIKALKLEELASKSDDVLDAALSSYDSRQPVIDVGLYGSTKALTASQLQTQLKKLGMEREELQTRLNMPSKRDGALKRLAELESEEKEINVHIDNVPGGSHEVEGYDLAWDEACKMMDEGKKDEAKQHLKSYMSKMSDKQVPAEPSLADPTEELTGLAEDMKKMQTSFEEFVKLAAPAFGATDEDLK
jgi:TusA-related sulfurtransferase